MSACRRTSQSAVVLLSGAEQFIACAGQARRKLDEHALIISKIIAFQNLTFIH